MSLRAARWSVLAVGAALLVGAAPVPPPLDAEVARLERERDDDPDDEEVRDELGLAYYHRARAALDRREYAAYERDLDQAMDEWIESLRLEPDAPSPHTMMGIVAAYQGDLTRALTSFANARRLAPDNWVAYTNLAQTLVYRGNLEIEAFQQQAARLGANMALVELNYCLAKWRAGDLAAAERHFGYAKRLDPQVVETWDDAPVSTPIRSFGDLMTYCCSNPACGPYMADACKESNLEVQRRELPAESVRKELLIEMERRRALAGIYRQRKDLKIEVEKAEEPAPPSAPATPPAADH